MAIRPRTRPLRPQQSEETGSAPRARPAARTRPAAKQAQAPAKDDGPMTVSKALDMGLIDLDNNPDREYGWSDKVDYPQIIASYKDEATSYKSAIRAHCVDCMGGLVQSIKDCGASPDKEDPCALWPFRMGENPFDARTIKAKEKK